MRLGHWNDADTLILSDSHSLGYGMNSGLWAPNSPQPTLEFELHVRPPATSFTHHIPNMVMPLGYRTQRGMWKLPRAVYSSFCRLCTVGNTILRVASPIFSKGSLDSKLSMGSSNPCPLFPLIYAVTMLSWVKLIHMKARIPCTNGSLFSIPLVMVGRNQGCNPHEKRSHFMNVVSTFMNVLFLKSSRKVTVENCSLYLCYKFPNGKFNKTLK